MVRCIHQHDARHPHRITPHRNRFPQNSLRRNGCERNHFTCLSVYERNGQRGTSETVTPTLAHPNSSALSQLPVFLNSLAITDTAVPPIHAPFTPVHHSVTKQYYRQLSAEEAAAFGFTSPTIRKQERRISQ